MTISSEQAELIIHAGLHKTGTTSIQQVLSSNEQWLEERGYYYLRHDRSSFNQNALAWAIATKNDSDFEILRKKGVFPDLSFDKWIISSEAFSQFVVGKRQFRKFDQNEYFKGRRKFLKRLSLLCEKFDKRSIFICFRRHDDFAVSHYATGLISGRFSWSFAQYLEKFRPIFDYCSQRRVFEEVFERVCIADFDSLRDDLVGCSLDWMGIPAPPRSSVRSKATPDARVIAWLHWIRCQNLSQKEVQARSEFARTREASALFRLDPPSSLWESDAQRRAFLACCTDPRQDFRWAKPTQHDRCVRFPSTEDIRRVEAGYQAWRKPRRLRRFVSVVAIRPMARRFLSLLR